MIAKIEKQQNQSPFIFLGNTNTQQIKSLERVRNLAEVYTPANIVNDMLNLVEEQSYSIESTFLEPSCGNGNFLEIILQRKLQTIFTLYHTIEDIQFYTCIALGSIYAIDICEENVVQARERLLKVIEFIYNAQANKYPDKFTFFTVSLLIDESFKRILQYICSKNILCEDMLNPTNSIIFIEYKIQQKHKILRKEFYVATQNHSKQSLFETEITNTLKKYKPCYYLDLK